MAFHVHLMDPLRNYVPAAAPLIRQPAGPAAPEHRLSLRWEAGDDGRPLTRWIVD